MFKKILVALIIISLPFILFLGINNYAKKSIDSFVNNFNKENNVEMTHGKYGIDFKFNFYIDDLTIKSDKKEILLSKHATLNVLDAVNNVNPKYNITFNDFKFIVYSSKKDALKNINDFRKHYIKDNYLELKKLSLDYYFINDKSRSTANFKLVSYQNDVLNVNISANNSENLLNTPNSDFGKALSKIMISKISFDFENFSLINNILQDLMDNNSEIKTIEESELLVIDKINQILNNNDTIENLEKQILEELVIVIKDKKGFIFESNPDEVELQTLLQTLAMLALTNRYNEMLEVLNFTFEAKK